MIAYSWLKRVCSPPSRCPHWLEHQLAPTASSIRGVSSLLSTPAQPRSSCAEGRPVDQQALWRSGQSEQVWSRHKANIADALRCNTCFAKQI